MKTSIMVRWGLLCCVLAFTSPAHAQHRPARVWAGFGVGATGSTSSTSDATAVLVQLVHQNAPHHLALRLLVSGELSGGAQTAAEIGVLYGRVVAGDLGHAAIGGGLAYTDPGECSGEAGSCATVGLPLVAEAGFSPLTLVGLGLQGFANLNTEASYFGLVAMVQLGWMP